MIGFPKTTGATGPTGPTGTINNPVIAFAANSTGDLITINPNTPALIPLPDQQSLSPEVTPNATSTEFTVAQAGLYRIGYFVNLATPDSFVSQLLINGAIYAPSVVDVGDDVNSVATEVFATLAAGDVVSLGVLGEPGNLDLSAGSGAVLIIQQIGF